jgi:hypothetical protein
MEESCGRRHPRNELLRRIQITRVDYMLDLSTNETSVVVRAHEVDWLMSD